MAFYINPFASLNVGNALVDTLQASEITAAQGTFTNLAASNLTLAGSQTAPEFVATVSVQAPIIKSANDMFIQTNGTTRLTIQDTGIALDNASTKVLALSDIGTDIVYKTDIIDLDSPQVLTNKTIDSASNTIQVSGTNINSLVGQDVRSSANPSFASVITPIHNSNSSLTLQTNGADRLVIPLAGTDLDNTATTMLGLSPSDNKTLIRNTNVASIVGSQVLSGKTISSSTNTITIGGNNINTIISQPVTIGSNPSFTSVGVTNVNASGTVYATNVDSYDFLGVQPLTIKTAGTNRIVIPNAGIPTDNTITNVLGLQGTTLSTKTNIADTSTAQALTNKTINSASNTIQVNGTNINSLVNQDVRTTAIPTFASISLNSASISGSLSAGSLSAAGVIGGPQVDTVTLNVTGTSFLAGVSASLIGATGSLSGPNTFVSNTLKAANIDSYDNFGPLPITIKTAGTTRLVIPNAGIPLDNTITNVLGLQGTTLSYTTGLITASSSTVMTNKTIDSASNAIQISGTNINSLINQDVRTTANPTFGNLTTSTIKATNQNRWYSNTGIVLQVVPNAVETAFITLNSNIVNTQNGISYSGGGGGTGIFTLNIAGLYLITLNGNMEWTAPGGNRSGFIYCTGMSRIELFRSPGGMNYGGTLTNAITGSHVRYFNAGETFYITLYQDSGQNRAVGDTVSGLNRTTITIVQLS
jgi:hypothetical protein